eukprot:contig_12967_g3095
MGTMFQVLGMDADTGRACWVVLGGDMSSTGTLAVLASVDGRVRVWDVERGSLVRVLSETDYCVTCLALVGGDRTGRGARVVSGSVDGTVRVYSVDGKEPPRVLGRQNDAVTCLVVMGSDRRGSSTRVVSGSVDGKVKVWDMDNGSATKTLEGHDDCAACLAVVVRDESPSVASVAAAKPTMSSVLADKSACAYAALMKARLAIIEEPKTMTQTTIIATVTANVVDLRTLILAHFILKVATLDSLRATLDEVCVRVSKGEASTAYLFRCGQALSDSILLLREELDAKERKRKQLAVANSVVKVVVSLAPIVGGVIGSSVEAAANILSGIDPASFSSGANMMSFVQDFDKVKAVDTILAQIPEVLSDEQRAALDGGLSLENVRQEFAMAANFGLQRPQSSEVDEDGAPQSLLRTCAAQSSSSGEAKCAFNDVIDSEDLR